MWLFQWPRVEPPGETSIKVSGQAGKAKQSKSTHGKSQCCDSSCVWSFEKLKIFIENQWYYISSKLKSICQTIIVTTTIIISKIFMRLMYSVTTLTGHQWPPTALWRRIANQGLARSVFMQWWWQWGINLSLYQVVGIVEVINLQDRDDR